MVILIIFAATLGIVTSLLLLGAFLFVYFFNKKDIWEVSKFEFDLLNWRVKRDLFLARNNNYDSIINDDNFKKGLWISIETFFNHLHTTELSKTEIRYALLLAKQDHLSQTIEIEIKPQLKQKNLFSKIKTKVINSFKDEISAKLEITSIEDGRLHANFTRLNKIAAYEKEHHFEFKERMQLLKMKHVYKTFIGIIVPQQKRAHFHFFQKILYHHFWDLKIHYFEEDDIVYLVLADENLLKLRKRITKLQNFFLKSNHSPFLRAFIINYAIVEMQNFTYVDNIEYLKLRMRFALYKSALDKKTYWFTNDAKDLRAYESYKKAHQIILRAVQNLEIKTKLSAIKETNSDKVLTYLAQASTNLLSPKYQFNEIILQDQFYIEKINDAFLERFFNHQLKKRNVFLKISFPKFKLFLEKILTKKIIPVIEIVNHETLEKLDHFLKKHPLQKRIALSISDLDISYIDFLLHYEINYLFINKELTQHWNDDKNIMKLFYLAEKIASHKLKLIFDLKDSKLNETQRRKIGLKYFLENN